MLSGMAALQSVSDLLEPVQYESANVVTGAERYWPTKIIRRACLGRFENEVFYT